MKKSQLCIVATTLLLGACGQNTVKQTLGLDSRAPDEFRVVSRPPLSVPPQFELRPPGIEGAGTQPTQRDKAQNLVLGDDGGKPDPKARKGKNTKDNTSAADTLFLQKAGAADADPNVKKELTEKKINDQLKQEDQSWWDRVTTIPGSKDPVVKADSEADRIKKNQEAGKPVTDGKTPETGGGTISTLKHWIGDE